MDFLTKENADNLDLIRKILADSGFSEIKNITRLQSGSRSVAYYADDYTILCRVGFLKITNLILRSMKNAKNVAFVLNQTPNGTINPNHTKSCRSKVRRLFWF